MVSAFSNTLKRIELEDTISRSYKKIERHDQNGVFEIRYGDKRSYWRIVKKTLRVSDDIKEERRKDIEETELVLAFPLKNDGTADVTQEQHVFAFLPIRKYGVKFIIQADFILPLGREDIIRDNDWNKWLRNSIVDVFSGAIEQFKMNEKLKYDFYGYIPFRDVEDEFFVSVKDQIYENLQNRECILTEDGKWKEPSEVLLADEDVKKLITNIDLHNFFGKK